ncbi:hypothetical protein GCM10009733_021140 [Nonomuraea maheshkhaliensis]|uniref:Uncharacterized protein n=1 Tax=Nonomuraea maheshkhaliensis TaxID=419590 RepID=A0ABP4QYB9_9ACTN
MAGVLVFLYLDADSEKVRVSIHLDTTDEQLLLRPDFTVPIQIDLGHATVFDDEISGPVVRVLQVQKGPAAVERVTTGELTERLRAFPAHHEVWITTSASPEGYQPLTGQAYLGEDPDPCPGEPRRFLVLITHPHYISSTAVASYERAWCQPGGPSSGPCGMPNAGCSTPTSSTRTSTGPGSPFEEVHKIGTAKRHSPAARRVQHPRRVWAIPHESPAEDQGAFMAYIVRRFESDEHEYPIRFIDPAMPTAWAAYQRQRYDQLELIR